MANVSNAFGVGDNRDPDISLEMLDYKYIDECNNVKEHHQTFKQKTLEKILKTLKSGREGYFPHLVKHCEEKVAKLNPKSRYLRTEKKILKSRDLPNDEADKLANGMGEWLNDMKSNEASTTSNGVTEKELPPIRTNANVPKNKDDNISGKKSKKSQRIKGSDFKSWDKYDVDEECRKVDDPEYVSTKKKKVTLSHTIDSSKMTESEKQLKAGREKDKGNEAFAAGDFEEALAYYSRSISLHRSAASINNRALTYLRLEKWTDAEKDCNEVLKLEQDNVKAKLRRASALKELGRFEEAKSDLEFVLELEPNNARAQKILKEIEPKLVKKGRKMKILEVEEDEENETLVNGTSVPESKQAQESNNQADSGAKVSRVESESTTKVDTTADERKVGDSEISNSVGNEISNNAIKAPEESTPIQPETETPKEVAQTPLPAELEKVKAEAGNLFRAGQYGAASVKYTKAIDRLQRKAQNNPDANYSHALATLYSNRAACCLKSGDDKGCIADCNRALEEKPADVKALIRRATSYEHMEKYKLAYEDFREAQGINWSATQAQSGANRVAKHLRDVYGPNWRESIDEKAPKTTSNVPKSTTVLPKSSIAKSVKKPKSSVPQKEKSTKTVNTSLKKEESAKANNSSKNVKSTRATEKPTVAASKTDKQSKIDDKDEKRAQISQKLFKELKEKGNQFVRKGNYAKAIENYTQCIKISPHEVASYTNRALCYLKLGKHHDALSDCTKALELDPNNVKAYYRRAQANKNVELYLSAERNLKKVLEIEPANKPAISELAQVRKLIEATSRRKVPVVDVSEDEDSSSEEEEDKPAERKESLPHSSKDTAIQNEAQNAAGESTENTSGTNAVKSEGEFPVSTSNPTLADGEKSEKCSTPFSTDALDGKTVDSAKKTTAPKQENEEISKPSKAHHPKSSISNEKPVTNISDFRSQVPKNLSPYEFGNLWNSVQPKTNVEAYKCILDNITIDDIPAIVSNKTNDHLIVTFAQIAQMHMSINTASECDRAYNILLKLTKADRFEMAAMFLSKADKSVIQSAFTKLENLTNSLPVKYSNSDITSLKKLYMF